MTMSNILESSKSPSVGQLFNNLIVLNKKLNSWKNSKEYLSSLLLYYRLKRIEFELKRLYKDLKRDTGKENENEEDLEVLKRNANKVSLLFEKKTEKNSSSTYPSFSMENAYYFQDENFTFITAFEREIDEGQQMIATARIEYMRIKKNEVQFDPPNNGNVKSWNEELNALIELIKFFNEIRGKRNSWSLLYPFPRFLEQGVNEDLYDQEDHRGKDIEKIRRSRNISRLAQKVNLQFIYECIHIDKNVSIASLLLDAEPIIRSIVKRWCDKETDIIFLNNEYIRDRHKRMEFLYRVSSDGTEMSIGLESVSVSATASSMEDRNKVTERSTNDNEKDLPLLNLWSSMDNSLKSSCLHKNLFDISECKLSMFRPSNLVQCGISLNEILYHLNYSIQELKSSNIPVSELKREGVSIGELLKGGYSLEELREASYSVGEIQDTLNKITLPFTFSINDYVQAGYNAYQLRYGGFSATDFVVNDLLTDIEKKSINLINKAINYEEQSENKKKEFAISDLRQAGYSCHELFEIGYSCEQLKDAGFNLRIMFSTQLFTIQELVLAGFQAHDFKMAGILADELIGNSLFNEEALIDAGYSRKSIITYKDKMSGLNGLQNTRSNHLLRHSLSKPFQSSASYLKDNLLDGADRPSTYGSIESTSKYSKYQTAQGTNDTVTGYIELKERKISSESEEILLSDNRVNVWTANGYEDFKEKLI